MKIISANWREIRVQCVCWNVIPVVLGALRVRCKCGKSELLSELQDRRLGERSLKPNKLEPYLWKEPRL